MIGIIDYGMGNLTSIQNALASLSIGSEIVSDPDKLSTYDKAILPGVGAFGRAMESINRDGLQEAIHEFALIDKKPFLGICLGMQLLLESSEEHGFHKGLGLVKGHVADFTGKAEDHPVPHMGWNSVAYKSDSQLFGSLSAEEYDFYFVHRFFCETTDQEDVAGETEYVFKFVSAIEKENIFGCQFHPEKSQARGLEIFKNFWSL